MLKVSVNSGKDYLDYLAPYIIHILTQEEPSASVTDDSIRKKIKEMFGFEIPSRTVQVLLKRLARSGMLTRANSIYTINHSSIPQDNIPQRKAEVDRHVSHVIEELIRYAKEHSGKIITEEEAHSAVIASLENFSIQFLRSYLQGTVLPALSSQADWEIVLVANFIKKITSNPELFDSFEKIVEGHMFANALLCPDLQEVSDNFTKVTFYFDTSLLIELLGLGGKEKEDAVKELISLIHNLKGKVSYFAHTIEEVHNVLGYASEHINDPSCTIPVVLASRKNRLQKADLILKKENAETTLSALGISKTAKPDYDQQSIRFNIDEQKFEKILEEKVNYRHKGTAQYDVKSVRSIYVLRGGSTALSIEKSVAVFVSSNTKLAQASNDYEKEIEKNKHTIPSVITDFSLANIAWLKAPQGAPSLPRKEVLAFAYAASTPTQDFWKKVLTEAEKLEKEGRILPRDHQLLRSDSKVIDELMGLTLGEDSALTAQSISDTISRVSAEIKKEETGRLNQEQRDHQKTKDSLAKANDDAEQIKQTYYWICKNEATEKSKFIYWSYCAVLGIIGIATIASSLGYGSKIITSIITADAILAFLGWHFELAPKTVRGRYAEWKQKKLFAKVYPEIDPPRSNSSEITLSENHHMNDTR
jgi:predicted transcriptional regulator